MERSTGFIFRALSPSPPGAVVVVYLGPHGWLDTAHATLSLHTCVYKGVHEVMLWVLCRNEPMMGVYTRSGRVDHCAAHRGVPLLMLEGIQALYPCPHYLLAHTVVYGCETAVGSGYMAVRVPGEAPYPVHPGRPPPGCGRPRDDHTDDGYAGAVPLPRPSPSNTSWVGG